MLIMIMTIFSSSLDILFAGIFLGAVLVYVYLKIMDYLYIKNSFKKPLEELENRGLSIYTFLYRQGNYVVLSYDVNNYVYLDLNTQSIIVYKGDKYFFGTHPSLKSEYSLFYNKLINKFQREIYFEIIKINNIEYSINFFSEEVLEYLKNMSLETNLSPDVTKNSLTMDDILDKINQSGINSLTDNEKEFLRKNSEEENNE